MSFYIDKELDLNYKFIKKIFIILILILSLISLVIYFYSVNKSKPYWSLSSIDLNLKNIKSINKSKNGYLLTGEKDIVNLDAVEVIEINEKGEKLWNRTFSKDFIGNDTYAKEINNNYIISYISYPDPSQMGKYNGVTNILDSHQRVINRISYFFKSIALCEDGFISFSEDNKLFRFNDNGKKIWEKEILYEKPSKYFQPRFIKSKNAKSRLPDIEFSKVIKTFDNNYIVIAKSPFLIIKFTKDGEIIWKRDYTDYYYGKFIDILETKDKSLVALTYMYKNPRLKSRYRTINIVKISSIGDLKWDKEIVSIRELPASWSISSFKKNKYFINVHNMDKEKRDINYFFIINEHGEIEKNKELRITGSVEGIIKHSIPTNDGGVLLGGSAFYSNKEYFVVKGKTYERNVSEYRNLLYKLNYDKGIQPLNKYTITSKD